MVKLPNIYALDTARWARLLLWFTGSVLVAGGLMSLLVDFVEGKLDGHIIDYIIIIMAGMVILFLTTIVYHMIPRYYQYRRIEVLRAYYPDTRSGIVMGLQHDIREKVQGIMFNCEMLNERVSYAVKDSHLNEKMENMNIANNCLGELKIETRRLECFMDELKHTFEAEAQESNHDKKA